MHPESKMQSTNKFYTFTIGSDFKTMFVLIVLLIIFD